MVHPKIDRGFYQLSMNYPSTSKQITDMFIGRFKDDDLYHLLGYRPHDPAHLPPAEGESNRDIGIVRLPTGKRTLGELISGDILVIESACSKRKDKARYIKFN